MKLTDEQINSYESDAHKQVVEDDWVVVEWVYDLVKEVRAYKSQVEELQKALEQAKEFLSELYSLVGQDMDINPSAKKVYLSKIAYANNTFISQALERSESK